MTATALRTSINADLQMLNTENLRSVSRYVKSLTKANSKEKRLLANAKPSEDLAQMIDSLDSLCGAAQVTEEDINNDERLAYILRKNR